MREGDEDAFREFYLVTKKGIFAFLYGYYGHYQDTEDAMQDVYVQLRRNVLMYRPGTDARAWFMQMAKYKALNDLKRAKRTVLTSDEVLINVPVEDRERSGVATEALTRALNETEREIVIMHVMWGYKHREIAKHLDLPLGTVTSKYKR